MNYIANDDSFLYAKATAAMFAGVMAVTLAILYVIIRIGFEQYYFLVFKTTTLSLFFIFLPSFYLHMSQRIGFSTRKSWFVTDTFVGVIGIFIAALIGYLFPSSSVYIFSLFSIAGLFFSLTVMFKWWKGGGQALNLFFAIVTFLFTVWLACRWISFGAQNPLFEEQVYLTGVHKDTLFHTSISTMIQTYGVPSTGLDGLPYLGYHYGSHWLFAQLSTLLGTYPLRFYQLGFFVIFFPLFFYYLISLGFELKRCVEPGLKNWALRKDGVFWAIVLISHVGVIPLWLRRSAGILDSHYASESYRVSLIFLFIYASLILYFFESFFRQMKIKRWGDKVFLLLIVPVFLCILGFFKVSVMLLGVAVSLYLFVRYSLYKYIIFNFSLFLALLCVICTYFVVTSGYGDIMYFSPFNFKKVYASKSNFFVFITVHLFFSICFIIYRFYDLDLIRLSTLKEKFLNKFTVDIEIVLIFCLFGVIPGLVFAIGKGGNAIYFSDVQRWVAIAFLVAYSGEIRNYFNEWIQTIENKKGKKYKRVLAAILLGFLLISASKDVKREIYKGIKEITYTRLTALDLTQGKDVNSINLDDFLRLISSSKISDYKVKYQENKSYRVIQTLYKLQNLPLREKQKTILFIPKSINAFWYMTPRKVTFAVPFLAPAISGLAMINGLPVCDRNTRRYGFAAYQPAQSLNQEKNMSTKEIFLKAKKLGFSQVIAIEKDKNGMFKIRKFS